MWQSCTLLPLHEIEINLLLVPFRDVSLQHHVIVCSHHSCPHPPFPPAPQDVPLYLAVSNCAVDERESLRDALLQLLPAHSFGGCSNNVGGRGREAAMYPRCKPE